MKPVETNTPQLWDNLWENNPSAANDIYALVKEENSIRWQRLEEIVLQEFGCFTNLKVIEIGGGRGMHAALMAKRGASATVLDYSKSALKSAEQFFKHNGVTANFIDQDAFSLPPELRDKFDISMSFGLTEHFKGDSRVAITKAHFDVLRKGGLTFISVPNKYNMPYRIWKLMSCLRKTWKVGEEYPYSRQELKNICRQLGVTDYSFCGDSLVGSLNFILWAFNFNPFRMRGLRRFFRPQDNPKREKGTPLDAHFAYALVLCAKK